MDMRKIIKKYENKFLIRILTSVLLLASISFLATTNIKAAPAEDGISVKYYIMLLEKALGKTAPNPMKTAIEIGLVKKGEFTEEGKFITNEEAAVLANRADIINRKANIYDVGTYEDVKYKNRISDIITVKDKFKDEIYQVFSKGIMAGESNGLYSQSRKFEGNKQINRKSAFLVIKRVEDITKRKKISTDGQVIRTTNLPKNYKDHRYVLESFPNEFYEKKFEFEDGFKAYRKYLEDGTLTIQYYDMAAYSEHFDKNGNMVRVPLIEKEREDFARPIHFLEYPRAFEVMGEKYTGKPIQDMLDLELDMWTKKIETNLKARLNVNYNKINNNWYSQLRQTYSVSEYDTELNKRISVYLKDYMKYVKANNIILESRKIVVEPSTLYRGNSGDYIRCYVEFRMVSAKDKAKVTEEGSYIFTTSLFNKVNNIETGQWIHMFVDIPLGTAQGCEKAVLEFSSFRN